MNHEQLAAVAREIERQNDALAEAEKAVGALGDVALLIPQSFFDELEEATAPRNPMPTLPIVGVRG